MTHYKDWLHILLLEHVRSVVELVDFQILDPDRLHDLWKVLLLVPCVLVLCDHLLDIFKVTMRGRTPDSSLDDLIGVENA